MNVTKTARKCSRLIFGGSKIMTENKRAANRNNRRAQRMLNKILRNDPEREPLVVTERVTEYYF